jgi:type IV pilus assembly protein PilW
MLIKTRRAGPSLRQRGMSIIEMLVGVVIGLIVMAGAAKLTMDNFGANRRLVLEARVNQDLRAAADLIVRDIRRAGYWENAASGLFSTTGSGTVLTNPYRNIDLSSNTIRYEYARKEDVAAKYNTVEPVEPAGFRLLNGVLEFRNGASDPKNPDTDNWQAITNPNVVTITNFSITTPAARVVELYTYCVCLTRIGSTGVAECVAADFQSGGSRFAKRPTMSIRQFDVVLAGQSATDQTVQREIRETVRVRNDRLFGCCPNSSGVQACE